jgi:uncharacterized protein with PIN domain
MKHNKCGYEWYIEPNAFLRGNRCLKCSGKIKKTTEQFKQEVSKLVNNEYNILGEYINNKTKIEFIHNICGYKFMMKPNSFLSRQRCPKCSGKMKKNTEQFIQEVYDLVRDEYEVQGEYINNKIKIPIKHNICEHTWDISPNNFLKGYRCPKCAGLLPYTTETFKEKVYSLVQDEYSVLGEYINANTNIYMKHNICNFKYNVKPSKFLRGNRCPQCNESKGERKVRYYLENKNIIFIPQYTFNNLLSDYNNPLKFDFGVFDNNNNLKQLIEYDGKQHFEIVEGWTTEEEYNIIQYYDQLKNNYCKKYNIPLLRIPYWDFNNIENILEGDNNIHMGKKEMD